MSKFKSIKAYLSSIICLFYLLLISFSFIGCNETKKITANPSTDFKYSIDENTKEVVISEYIGTSTDVTIPKNIEGYTVKWIGARAFMNSNVESVNISSDVNKICRMAFANCQALKKVKINSTSLIIDTSAFENCKNLTDIKLPSGLTEIGVKAFSGCESLKKITIPETVETWGMEAFYGCPLSSLTFGDGIENIGSYACFWGSVFEEVTIPSSVEKIGEYAFHDNLEKVLFLGNAPTTLGKQPFGKKSTIYYKKGTTGWDNTSLKDIYKLVAQ